MDFGLSEAIFSHILDTKVVFVDDVNNCNVNGAIAGQAVDNCAVLFNEIYQKYGIEMEKKMRLYEKIAEFKLERSSYARRHNVLFVKTLRDSTVTVPFQSDCTIRELKQMIQEIENIPASWQRLIYENKLLKDKFTLASYSIQPNSYLNMTLKFRGGNKSLEVKTYDGETLHFCFNSQSKVRDLKQFIGEETSISVDLQIILYQNKELKNDQLAIDQIFNNLKDADRIFYVFQKYPDGQVRILGKQILSPEYDYDFTNINDSGKKFMRGGKEYKRPCGWKRIALNVNKKYNDSIWLGSSNVSGEWPVAYHGTYFGGIYGIAFNGFDISKFRRGVFGKGHYATPDIAIAEENAKNIYYNGKRYKFVIQCRVNPINMKIIDDENYWLLSKNEDIRPYSICLKPIS